MCALAAGCNGPQSALDPAGHGAEQIASLFWWLTAGAAAIWIAVVALTIYALRRPRQHTERKAMVLIIGGGFVTPTIILTVTLVFGLALLPGLLASPPDALRIRVSGEQWWWRVQYVLPDGETVELANEIRLPAGRPVEALLSSPDVLHSFWIPSIAGKIDMIPGRITRLPLEPSRTGVFRGVCAEYCGTSHALMAFDVVVVEPEEFDAWLMRQRMPVGGWQLAVGGRPPGHDTDAALLPPTTNRQPPTGEALFLASGCGACHTIRGTAADGVIGPDLTHVGSRVSLGAGTLRNEPRAFERFIARTDEIKPGTHMPAFGMLPPEDIRAIARYLESLQ